MTTRSGLSYKPQPEMSRETTPTPTESNTTPSAATPLPAAGEIAGLLDFMHEMLQDHAEECRQYEDESEKRLQNHDQANGALTTNGH